MLTILKGPYLQWPTADSVTVMWETSVPSSSRVTYARTQRAHSGGLQTVPDTEKSAESPDQNEIHSVVLEGLAPETSYHYRVSSTTEQGEEIESDVFEFRTAPRPETPIAFAVTSETGGYGDDDFNRRVFAQIASHRPDFLFVVGDSVSRGSRYDDWERYLFRPGHELFPHTPFYLCPGNHEENSPWFYRFTSFPQPGNYYSFDYGSVHVTALDSTALVDYRDGRPVGREDLRPGSAQHNFLVEDLGSTDAPWKIVFFHYPPYVSGDYQVEEMRALCPVLENAGVDLVFNSHTIVYERSHPLTANHVDHEGGVRYIVAGGAGEKPDWFLRKRAWHTAHSTAVSHFVQVAVTERHLELRAIDLDGRLFDTLELRK